MELPFPSQELAPLYRFALLLTADVAAAEEAVVSAVAACAAHLESYRTPASRIACLLHHVREHCKKSRRSAASALHNPAGPVVPENSSSSAETPADAEAIAQVISTMQEPQRSAIALFYLNLLPAREIAALLKLTLEDLADALDKGRDALKQHRAAHRLASAISTTGHHEKTAGSIS